MIKVKSNPRHAPEYQESRIEKSSTHKLVHIERGNGTGEGEMGNLFPVRSHCSFLCSHRAFFFFFQQRTGSLKPPNSPDKKIT